MPSRFHTFCRMVSDPSWASRGMSEYRVEKKTYKMLKLDGLSLVFSFDVFIIPAFLNIDGKIDQTRSNSLTTCYVLLLAVKSSCMRK